MPEAIEWEIEMRDWADGIEQRNYGIKRSIDVHIISELMRTIVAMAMIAGALLFYSCIRIQSVRTGYESQKLFSLEESLLRDQKRLILEQETLGSPERLDRIARSQLGMIPLHPNQLILPQFQYVERSAPAAMVMVGSEVTDLKKASPDKGFGNYKPD